MNVGILEDVDLDSETEFNIGSFVAPVGEPLQLELWIQLSVSGASTGGDSDSVGDFSAYLGSIAGGPVFDLPAGYSANSAKANIVSNFVPEPRPNLAAAVATVVLSVWARRRRAA